MRFSKNEKGYFLTELTTVEKFLVTGRISKPAIKKRMPANCNGVVYCSPILIPTKAVDHNKQAIMARKYV